MNNQKTHWEILAVVAFITLLWVASVLPPLAKPKARASRSTAVNHIASVSMAMPGTQALPDPAGSK